MNESLCLSSWSHSHTMARSESELARTTMSQYFSFGFGRALSSSTSTILGDSAGDPGIRTQLSQYPTGSGGGGLGAIWSGAEGRATWRALSDRDLTERRPDSPGLGKVIAGDDGELTFRKRSGMARATAAAVASVRRELDVLGEEPRVE